MNVSLIRIYLALSEASTGYPRRGAFLLKPWIERAKNDQDIFTLWSLIPTLVYCLLLAGEYTEAEEASSSMPVGAERAPLFDALRVHRASLLLARRRPKEAEAILEDLLSAPFAGRLAFFPEYLLRAKIQLALTKLALAKDASFISRRLLLRQAWSTIQPVLSSDDPILEGSGLFVWLASSVRRAERRARRFGGWIEPSPRSPIAERRLSSRRRCWRVARSPAYKTTPCAPKRSSRWKAPRTPASREGDSWG